MEARSQASQAGPSSDHCLSLALARAGLEVEQEGPHPASIWDDCIAGGGFTCYTTILASSLKPLFNQHGMCG